MKFCDLTRQSTGTRATRGLGLSCKDVTPAEESIGHLMLALANAINGIPQCSLLRIFHTDRKYVISWGFPSDSDRHGVGEEGFWEEPIRKEALIRCIETKERVVIEDVFADKNTVYLHSLARAKGIYALLFQPFLIDGVVKLVAIFDLVRPDEAGWTDIRLAYIDQFKELVYTSMIPLVSGNLDMNKQPVGNAMAELRHRVINGIASFGGSAKFVKERILKQSDKLELLFAKIKACLHDASPAMHEKAALITEIERLREELSKQKCTSSKLLEGIVKDAQRQEQNANNFTALIYLLLCSHRNSRPIEPLKQCLNLIESRPYYDVIRIEDYVREVEVDSMLFKCVISEIDELIRGRSMPEHRHHFEAKQSNGNIVLRFISSAIHPVVASGDLMKILQQVIHMYNGSIELYNGSCVIALPPY